MWGARKPRKSSNDIKMVAVTARNFLEVAEQVKLLLLVWYKEADKL